MEALLSFVDRIARDREFREWFAVSPGEALASYRLSVRELRDLDEVLAQERRQRATALALRPLVRLLVETAEAAPTPVAAMGRDDTAGQVVYERLTAEVAASRARLAAAREAERSRRPWWKFWE